MVDLEAGIQDFFELLDFTNKTLDPGLRDCVVMQKMLGQIVRNQFCFPLL
ncbi:hypothetical protein SBDP1_1290009 [Syntrophobacter sp. SbD1]|nr:hypothetical protein SBDP1_1290009 [Syntrophobacter sp. SbD1]